MADKGTITLRGAFPANTTVKLYDRVSDTFSQGQTGNAVKSAKVSKESEVQFTGLEEGDRYWAAAEVDGEWRARAVTVKGPRPAKPRSKPLGSAAPGFDTSQNVKIVTGARSTKDRPTKPPPNFFHESIGQPSDNPEAAPHLSQEDARNVPQRSFTITGEAHPKPKDEFVPAVPQSEVPKSTPQRSSTELGEATVIPKGEKDVSPSLPQEDVRGKQRSATEEGEATPKPKAKPAKSDRLRKVQQPPSGARVSARQPASSAEKQSPQKQPRKSSTKKGRK